eukprot:11906633-Alexandrium_andersonii.AAC.1
MHLRAVCSGRANLVGRRVRRSKPSEEEGEEQCGHAEGGEGKDNSDPSTGGSTLRAATPVSPRR